jgi:hypothetical protein
MSECHSAISAPHRIRVSCDLPVQEVFRMRALLALSILALVSTVPVAAEDDPARAIRWNWSLQPENAPPGSEAELVVVATVAPHWVVYSSDFPAGLGPLPARIKRKPQSSLELVDALKSVGAARGKDETSSAEYGYFEQRAELRQRLRLPAAGAPVELTLSAQACNKTDGTCHLIRQDIRIPART